MVNFAILALVGLIQAYSMVWPMEISDNQVMRAPIGLPWGPTLNAESCLQATMEIYPWECFRFPLVFGYAKTPLLRPQFQPSMWSVGGPISLCP